MELTNIRCILTLFLLSAFRLDIFLPGFYVWKELWMQAIHFRHFRQSRANSSENLIDSYLAKFTSRPLFTSGSTWVEFCVACDTTALAPSGFKRTAGINTAPVSAFATRNARYDIIVGPRIFFIGTPLFCPGRILLILSGMLRPMIHVLPFIKTDLFLILHGEKFVFLHQEKKNFSRKEKIRENSWFCE